MMVAEMKQEHPDIESLILKTKQYQFNDGLFDFYLASTFVSWGVVSWFIFDKPGVWLKLMLDLSDAVGSWARWTVLLIFLLPVLVMGGMSAVISRVRRRWLWQNSGYARPLLNTVPSWISVLSAAVLLGMIFTAVYMWGRGLVDEQFIMRVIIVAPGLATGLITALLGRVLRVPRYIRIGVIGGLALIPLLFIQTTFGLAYLVFGLWWGLLFMISGCTALFGRLAQLREEAA